MKVRQLAGQNVRLDVPERSLRLMLDPIEEGLDDIFLEKRRARIAAGPNESQCSLRCPLGLGTAQRELTKG